MEKPGWVPLVLGGAVPREVGDFLAILVMGLGNLEASLIAPLLLVLGRFPLLGLLTVAPTCALASLTNTSDRLREELALFAYGGSAWHVGSKYFLKGTACTLVSLVPLFLFRVSLPSFTVSDQILYLMILVASGGISYSLPGLNRIRSHDFVENYKA